MRITKAKNFLPSDLLTLEIVFKSQEELEALITRLVIKQGRLEKSLCLKYFRDLSKKTKNVDFKPLLNILHKAIAENNYR